MRALLLAGDDTGRRAGRKALTQTALAVLAGRELPADTSREHAVRHDEIRRFALALGQARQSVVPDDAGDRVIRWTAAGAVWAPR
jgi:hypothetical protein